jgi:hypothetical protein
MVSGGLEEKLFLKYDPGQSTISDVQNGLHRSPGFTA